MKRRILAALAALALGIGVVAAGPANPASASPLSVAKYVALGDSIAAGQGGGPALDACQRTDGGYAAQLDDAPKINLLRNAACTGATIAGTHPQLSQVNRGTTVVTLTVGANDLGLDGIYAACASVAAGADPVACFAAIQAAIGAAPGTVGPLTSLIGAIAQRSPNATIVVTGYAHLFESPPPLPEFAGLAALVAGVNGAIDALNGAIQAAVGAAAAGGANVHYADVVDAFAGHGVQLAPGVPSDPWFGIDPVGDPAGFLHPTYAGYTAYTNVIRQTLGR
ncbi:GDSL-type esterase/lipase family protein [Microbacterium sp. NPDC019599]|uniref:GDSL-type esterase/lipase family protein n=1 Tax=Microbacterium sp. NPDC019599 TaxID=3154690 RepID=UPI0033C8867A